MPGEQNPAVAAALAPEADAVRKQNRLITQYGSPSYIAVWTEVGYKCVMHGGLLGFLDSFLLGSVALESL